MYTFPKAQPVYWWGCGKCVLYYIMNIMKVKTPTISMNIDQFLNTQDNSHVSPKARPVYWWGCGEYVMAWTLMHELILDQVLGHPKSNVCISKGSASVLVGLRNAEGVYSTILQLL